MSEYQYYEFQKVEGMLNLAEIKELRKVSSRGKITPVSFINEYHYGDFKGEPSQWIEKYFDAFLCYANWGTRELIFRFSKDAVDVKLLKKYCVGESVNCWLKNEYFIIHIEYNNEDGFVDESWSESETLSDFISLRGDVFYNDYRLFYLLWLLQVQLGEVGESTKEPPVPYGLKKLSSSLQRFADFFRIDGKLISRAAENSTEDPLDFNMDDLDIGIIGLNQREKFKWLSNLAMGYDNSLGPKFRKVVVENSGVELFCYHKPRRVGELIS